MVLDRVPSDILTIIAAYTEYSDLLAFRLTCKALCRATKKKAYWIYRLLLLGCKETEMQLQSQPVTSIYQQYLKLHQNSCMVNYDREIKDIDREMKHLEDTKRKLLTSRTAFAKDNWYKTRRVFFEEKIEELGYRPRIVPAKHSLTCHQILNLSTVDTLYEHTGDLKLREFDLVSFTGFFCSSKCSMLILSCYSR